MEHRKPTSIGRETAIELANTKWWENVTAREAVEFQFATQELCMPFEEFHRLTEKVLGRPVYTHEFGLNWGGLVKELAGEKQPPTLAEIIDLIPAEKRVIIVADTSKNA